MSDPYLPPWCTRWGKKKGSVLEACFADVFGLQQLRVLQHNWQDHRIDAGTSAFLSFWRKHCLVLGDVQPADRHGSQVPRPQLNFPDWGEPHLCILSQILTFKHSGGRRAWQSEGFYSQLEGVQNMFSGGDNACSKAQSNTFTFRNTR